MSALAYYSFGSFAWLSLQAVPLAIWPTFIISLLTPDYQHANQIEQYFARSLGVSELTIGLLLVVLTGALPLTSLTDTPAEVVSPYQNAVVLISMFYHATSTFYDYARYNGTGQLGYLLGAIGSGAFAAFALWVMMFADSRGHISRRTGADKRTSGFPFKNAEADKRLKGKSL
ncbi:hypothetical protein QBC46DRAFT_393310 [Diplogelasinospora grovesii]|uniref:Uncharacterized protein n=1 Tax=Diplogelasinospora grovesii TaxID=303347 RepID=A0AAN6N1R3_9PEZI|nr:hypothetical protein QBC46DRAFT_393310 [Diplogelasinospora grovesii]